MFVDFKNHQVCLIPLMFNGSYCQPILNIHDTYQRMAQEISCQKESEANKQQSINDTNYDINQLWCVDFTIHSKEMIKRCQNNPSYIPIIKTHMNSESISCICGILNFLFSQVHNVINCYCNVILTYYLIFDLQPNIQ